MDTLRKLTPCGRRLVRPLVPVLLAALLLVQACEKEARRTQFSMPATIEQPTTAEADGQKSQLVGEQWIYWEDGDIISIKSDQMADFSYSEAAWLAPASFSPIYSPTEYERIFVTELPEESKYFLALFPQSDNNVINATKGSSTFTSSIFLPREQPVSSDTTFDHSTFPMVAWYGGQTGEDEWEKYHLHFHSLGGIVRLQLFNQSAIGTIDSIVVRSTDGKQLWGSFAVGGYKTANPWLSSTEASKNSIVITKEGGIDFAKTDSVHSFYLVLPAFQTAEERDTEASATLFGLDLTVYSHDGENNKIKFNAAFTAKSRRRAITYLQALGIKTWVDATSDNHGTAARGLVGNGTEARPYKIYSVDDLEYLRQCFAGTNPTTNPAKVNGKEVKSTTQFRLMTSTLTLPTGWEGIENFCGVLKYQALSSGGVGIVNNSPNPLFTSIAAGGRVEDIGVSSTVGPSSDGQTVAYALLCGTNNGEIVGCDARANGTLGKLRSGGVAGLCVTNYGLIEACGCVATISNVEGPVGGICLTNGGTVRGCYVASQASLASSAAGGTGGIVNVNNGSGVVEDCYFATRVLGAACPWGGIVYSNYGTVRHCYIGGDNAIITDAEVSLKVTGYAVGGIVCNSSAGLVTDCWCSATELWGSCVGGIVANASGSAIIANCYINNAGVFVSLDGSAATYGGGLVGNLGGNSTLANSFAYLYRVANSGTGTTGGLVGHQGASARILNSYAYELAPTTAKLCGVNDGTANITRCYLVGGTPSDGIAAMTSANFASVLSTLNSVRDSLDALPLIPEASGSCRQWVANSKAPVGMPVLDPYTVAPALTARR